MIRKLVISLLSFLKDERFLRELEARILFFTSSVVLLACATFTFGGTCAAWQWYVPLVLASCWGWRFHRHTAFAFVLILVAMWLAAPLWLDSYACCDTPAYHLPMVRLLTFGWNPFTDPEAHGICETMGLDWWGMRPYHVAYCSKPAAIFSAVAYSFVRDPYALTYPLPFLLLVSVCVTSLRVFRQRTIAVALLMMLLLWCYLPQALFVDCSLMLVSAGLLVTMYADLRDQRFSFIPLAGYGFWMLNLKLPGVLAAGVFFLAFTLAMLWKNRTRRQFAGLAILGVMLTLASCLASFNPYGTSFRDKGHPLYPFKTVDAAKYPIRDMCMDFKVINDDAAQMGRLGTLVHSYLSPRLACAYYKWKLHRTNFTPHKLVWDYRWHDDPKAMSEPTRLVDRVQIVLTILLMLAIPVLRPIGFALLVLLMIFPFEQIGFLRYQPWIHASFCLSVSVAVARFSSGWHSSRPFLCVGVVGLMLIMAVRELSSSLEILGCVMQEQEAMPSKVYSCYEQPKPLLPQTFRDAVAQFLDRKKTHSMNLILRNRQGGGVTEVITVGDEDILNMEVTHLGYYVVPLSVANTRPSKWIRIIRRIGHLHRLPENYLMRLRRMIGCQEKRK